MSAKISVAAACVLMVFSLSVAQAQDVDRVRALYNAAAYEEALAALAIAKDEPARTDVEQYRALCLLALGREPEAIAAVERLVQAHPMFVPPVSEASPRIVSIVTAVRARLVPDIVKRTYADGKAAYSRRDLEAAHSAFQRTLDLIDGLAETEQQAFADLRLLATEFRDLSTPPASPVPPVAPVNGLPEPDYVAPVAVRESLPAWNPPDLAASRTAYTGVLRLKIGADGVVESAAMVRSTHPTYDLAAVRAAKRFLYKPATRGGSPVAAQKDIEVRLVPR